MKHKILYLLIILGLGSCAVEDDFEQNPFVVAFTEQSTNYANVVGEKQIDLVFSEQAETSGFVKIRIDASDAAYGTDFITIPEKEGESLILPFYKGDKNLHFIFKNLIDNYSIDDQAKQINFVIEEINYNQHTSIQGNTHHVISFNSLLGGTVEPNVGGPNQGNQVFYDLSTGASMSVRRDQWDLGFYAGDEFRVILNGSLYMAAKALDAYDIDAVNQNNIPSQYFDEVGVGTFDPENEEYIDSPDGNLENTAIQEITVDPVGNPVYLINLGNEVGTITPNVGGVAVAGERRGWKKVRILRQENGYLLHYADLNDITHQEIFIPKEPAYNFSHFSFNAGEVRLAQPPKEEWDLCFTVFTNVVTTPDGTSAGSYGFSDFVVNNVLADAKAFMVMHTANVTYANYQFNEEEATALLSDDQRTIGSYWRDVFNGVYTDRFFVMNDANGNWYKIRFLAFKNENGERGYPKFQYEQIN